ncbi:MAG: hypothetical protein AAFX01_08150 [Cyanobacteria bacterium J06638_28]
MFMSAQQLPLTLGAMALAMGSIAATATPGLAATLYSDRSEFLSVLEETIEDDYDSAGYQTSGPDNALAYRLSDESMNAVLGETQYVSKNANTNFILDLDVDGDYHYCAGCADSFLMNFANTSLTEDEGVLGVGFDIPKVRVFLATVYFVDGTQQDFDLAKGFWGITSDVPIRAINFGSAGGQSIDKDFRLPGDPNTQPDIELDNLTIGSYTIGVPSSSNSQSIPEPSILLGLSLVGAYNLYQKRQGRP